MAAQVIGALTAGASRYVVSNYNLVPTPAAITYNLVDMALCVIVSHIPNDPIAGILASRIVGVIAGVIVATALCGSMDLMVAIALNVTSLAVSLIMAVAMGQRGGEFLVV
ncbi:MAG: hypothetical protein ACHQT8_07415 [Chlamydiales bacterium]